MQPRIEPPKYMPNTPDRNSANSTTPKRGFRALLSSIVLVFVDLLRRPSLTLASGGLLATYLAKIDWYTEGLERYGNIKMSFMAFLASDLLFWSAIVFLILLLESLTRGRWMRLCTGLFAFVLTLFSVANVFWLRGTGDQIHLAVVKVALNRTAEVLPIAKSGLGTKGLVLLGATVLLPVMLTLLFRAKWRKDRHPERWRWATAAFPLLLLLLAGWGWVEQSGKRIVGWRLIAANVHTALLDELVNSPVLHPPPKSAPDPLRGVAHPASQPGQAVRPNIVVVVLEATAFRATSLSDKGPPTTPFLRALAGQGLQATSMRTVLPHTSKSLFSIFCGRYPSMQHRILETADNYPSQCLPKVLKKLGYDSAFFQSADGRFEGRPRLVANMGFDKFVGWQDLRPPPPLLGYLAANDMALVKPALGWAAKTKDNPFFMGILTSASHHPYHLPRWIASKKAIGQGSPKPLRYLALIHGADEMLRRLVLGIQRVNSRPTIFVITGDHGEAFGEHGGQQHDNIYTEEGLHVPFVLLAPGIAPGSSLPQPRSLIDVAPTLFDLIKQPIDKTAFDGRSLFSSDADADSDVPRYFACWYDNVCAGKVTGTTKVVTFPNVQGWAVYDLAADPDEVKPKVEGGAHDADAKEIVSWYRKHRYSKANLKWSERKLYDGWLCPEGKIRCKRSE
jgi:lipoteichoic acid synthase